MRSAGVIDFIGSMRESETVYSLASSRPNITIRGGRRDRRGELQTCCIRTVRPVLARLLLNCTQLGNDRSPLCSVKPDAERVSKKPTLIDLSHTMRQKE